MQTYAQNNILCCCRGVVSFRFLYFFLSFFLFFSFFFASNCCFFRSNLSTKYSFRFTNALMNGRGSFWLELELAYTSYIVAHVTFYKFKSQLHARTRTLAFGYSLPLSCELDDDHLKIRFTMELAEFDFLGFVPAATTAFGGLPLATAPSAMVPTPSSPLASVYVAADCVAIP